MERKLGIFCDYLKGYTSVEALQLLKNAGFTCFTTNEYKREDIKALREKADELGLYFDSIHAPFLFDGAYCNDVWKENNEKGDIMYASYIETVDSASEFGVPYIVIHYMGGLSIPKINDFGLKRFDDLVEYAKSKNVTLAFENMIRIGPIAYAADRYDKEKNVGFCYDFGHAHCYSGYAYAKDVEWLDILRNRVVTTHIHDNEGFIEGFKGELDFHWMPFEGNLDYQKVMKKLDENNYTGSLIIEVFNGKYPDMSAEEFLAWAYERLKRISDMSTLMK